MARPIAPTSVVHYGSRRRQKCRICGPEWPAVAHELCNVHYQRRRGGMPDWETRPIVRWVGPGQRTGEGWLNKAGYMLVRQLGHPNANAAGCLFEHTLVMSEKIGRPLRRDETVHHKNGQRSDNRIENLELWSTSQPRGQRVLDKVTWAKEILALYDGLELAA